MSPRVAPTALLQDTLDLCGEIVSNTRNAVEVLDDLLNYDKLDVGGLTMDLAFVAPEQVLNLIVKTFKSPAENKRVTMVVNSAEYESKYAISHSAVHGGKLCALRVIGDKARLEQVVRNLIANALRFTAPQGKVEVTLTWEEHGHGPLSNSNSSNVSTVAAALQTKQFLQSLNMNIKSSPTKPQTIRDREGGEKSARGHASGQSAAAGAAAGGGGADDNGGGDPFSPHGDIESHGVPAAAAAVVNAKSKRSSITSKHKTHPAGHYSPGGNSNGGGDGDDQLLDSHFDKAPSASASAGGAKRRNSNPVDILRQSQDRVPRDPYSCKRWGCIRLSVSDDGAGMSAEQLRSVRSDDAQFNAKDLQAGQGSGLGLFIVKGSCKVSVNKFQHY